MDRWVSLQELIKKPETYRPKVMSVTLNLASELFSALQLLS